MFPSPSSASTECKATLWARSGSQTQQRCLERSVLLVLVQHHVCMSVSWYSQPGQCWFPHDNLQLWGERCQSTTLTPMSPWPEAISQGNTAGPGRCLTGVEERSIQVLPAFPWQSVVGPLLFWYDNYCPFRSEHIFSFWHLHLSPKAFLGVQWGIH